MWWLQERTITLCMIHYFLELIQMHVVQTDIVPDNTLACLSSHDGTVTDAVVELIQQVAIQAVRVWVSKPILVLPHCTDSVSTPLH